MVQALVPYLHGAAPATITDGFCLVPLQSVTDHIVTCGSPELRATAFSNSIRSIAALCSSLSPAEPLLLAAGLLLSAMQWGSSLPVIQKTTRQPLSLINFS